EIDGYIELINQTFPPKSPGSNAYVWKPFGRPSATCGFAAPLPSEWRLYSVRSLPFKRLPQGWAMARPKDAASALRFSALRCAPGCGGSPLARLAEAISSLVKNQKQVGQAAAVKRIL